MKAFKLVNEETGQRAELLYIESVYWFSQAGNEEKIGSKQRNVRRFLERRGYKVDRSNEPQDIAIRNI